MPQFLDGGTWKRQSAISSNAITEDVAAAGFRLEEACLGAVTSTECPASPGAEIIANPAEIFADRLARCFAAMSAVGPVTTAFPEFGAASTWHVRCLSFSVCDRIALGRAMYVSNTVAAQPPFQFRSYPPSPGVSTPSAADPSGAPQASSGRGGSYDFTSLTPKGFMKNVNDLFNAGKISQQDMNARGAWPYCRPGYSCPSIRPPSSTPATLLRTSTFLRNFGSKSISISRTGMRRRGRFNESRRCLTR